MWPAPSTTKPCVSKAAYGARPSIAQPVNNELWNQPRCWSEPSKYKSAGCCNSGRRLSTAACVEPESNQTSKVSVTFLYWSAFSGACFAKKVAPSKLNQASTPVCSVSKAACSNNSAVFGCGSPVSLCTNSGIGTPQLRWRDTHQSGRFLIMASKRARPQLGKNSVSSTALFAYSRKLFPDASVSFMPINHWCVANCMSGVL